MKKYLLLAIAGSFITPAFAVNLENPLYMTTKGKFYAKGIIEIPTHNHTDVVFGEEFGYGITKNIMVYQKLGLSFGDKIMGEDQSLSDLLVGANFRVIDEKFKFDIETRFSTNISKKYAHGQVFEQNPTSYGKSDNSLYLGVRLGEKIRKSILIAARFGYNYYFSDPRLNGHYLDGDDLSALNIGAEVAFQLVEDLVSLNFSLDRYESQENVLDKTIFGTKLNYSIKSNIMLSGYIAYDAEAEEDETTFGMRVGVEF